MKVIAIKAGFHNGYRKRVGEEFDYDAEKFSKKDKDGKPVLPKWLVPATPERKAELKDAQKADEKKAVNAIRAAAGPKRGGKDPVKPADGSDLV